jgi:hypothetical protein
VTHQQLSGRETESSSSARSSARSASLDPQLSQRPEARRAAHQLVASAQKSHQPLSAVESVQTPSHQLSLADQEKSRRRPFALGRFIAVCIVLMIGVILPFALGRSLGLGHTRAVSAVMARCDPRGWALISWATIVTLLTCLGKAIGAVGHHARMTAWLWGAYVAFLVEQFLGGLSMLKWNFWYSTHVVYGRADIYANAINLGILGAFIASLVFVLVFIIILIAVKPESRLNALTRQPANLLIFLVIEVIGLIVVLFGGMITLVA